MRPLVIANPASAGGRTGRVLGALRGPIEGRLGPCDLAETTRPGDGARLAREAAADGRRLVIALGGDGTIREVVHGLVDASASGSVPALGVLGHGTGGDLRRSLGLPDRLDRYLDAIAAGHTRPLDVARYRCEGPEGPTSGVFVNALSIGLGPRIDAIVARRGGGHAAAYLAAAGRALWASEVVQLEIELRRGEARESLRLATRALLVCNGAYVGGGWQVAPGASCSDGELDVVDLGAGGRLAYAALGADLPRGAHVTRPGVQLRRATGLSIHLVSPGRGAGGGLDVDGDLHGGLPVDIELLPGAIRVHTA